MGFNLDVDFGFGKPELKETSLHSLDRGQDRYASAVQEGVEIQIQKYPNEKRRMTTPQREEEKEVIELSEGGDDASSSSSDSEAQMTIPKRKKKVTEGRGAMTTSKHFATAAKAKATKASKKRTRDSEEEESEEESSSSESDDDLSSVVSESSLDTVSDDDDDDDDSDYGKKKKTTKKKPTAAKKKPQAKAAKTTESSSPQKKQPRITKKDVKEHNAKVAERQKTSVTVPGQVPGTTRTLEAEDPIVQKYSALNISELKDWLRHNDQVLGGTKGDLVTRCVDGAINGRLARCGVCGKGHLHFDAEKKRYECNGYFDETIMQRIKCKFSSETVRREAWLDPAKDPAATTPSSSSSSTTTTTTTNNDVAFPPEAAAELTPHMSDPRTLATILVKYLRGVHSSIPNDEGAAKMEVGKLLMGNKTAEGAFDPEKVFRLALGKFPARAPNPSGDASSSSAAPPPSQGEASALVEANEPIAKILDEMATLEKKLGGENSGFKAAAMRKAAIAVRGLKFEITEGAILAKPGKNKVENIGKGTAFIIDEYIKSGRTKSEQLEALREKAALV